MAKKKEFNGIWLNQDDFVQFTVMTDKQCKSLLLDLFEQFDNIKNFRDVSPNPFDKKDDPVVYLARERFVKQIQLNFDNYVSSNFKEVEAQQKRRFIEKMIPRTLNNPKLRETINKFCHQKGNYEESVEAISKTIKTNIYKDVTDDLIISSLEYAINNRCSFVESLGEIMKK